MKVFETNISILLLVFIQFTGYAQSEHNMINSSIIIPLKTGKNPSSLFEKLVIEPANLFIQSKPINKDSPHIQLELNVFENNTKYTTFLWCYDASSDSEKANYPKAYQNYSFDLKIDKEEVALVVEKLDFGKTMFIDLGQTAVIGKLEILFEDCVGERSEDINGNQTDAFNSYTISLSEEDKQKTVSFMSLNKHEEKALTIEWKHYKIWILEDSEKALKLIVFKKDS
ncbi:hypothetical protein ESY86_02415 [Subsaximicrobium wynnwilliamsii]|uniref:Uncharacterized protein n=1 Tax=Subsaximicrobium wynnwilliamsii TaxID=291179 RepID=A0A5C6ZQ89_9FLAO|nr:hypothetical protein [Subsaximicrobium wynnwilliamsii]TXD85480.1 hypothetical protein ESY87_00725 [Subsaximicrobium wynnwilliamsii]TXD90833.1 hypothetical protein ESY86_02415 [Subsaximicrobium wynnwilliamsii]TXE05340.1 hypothetical protein ESY88_00725 [Subsaximicrobium wynnwilliamsii]